MDSFQLKPLSSAGVAGAIDKVKQYRLLNEPGNAESICRDILLVDPKHKEGLKLFVLTLTDLFGRGISGRFEEALAAVASIEDSYERVYYTGLVYERRGKAHHRMNIPQCGMIAYDWLRRAMVAFEEAEQLSPDGDDQAILRWNACVRRIQSHNDLQPAVDDAGQPPVLDD